MSIEANKQVVRRYIEILSTADFDRLDEIVAEDVYDHVADRNLPIHIFRIADGKIAEHWAIRDDLGPAKQVGAIAV